MKNLNILSLLVVVALLFAVQPASAVVSVKNSQESTSASVSKKELKKQERMEKVMTKIQKKLDKWEKKGVDTSDPVNKWLWFAIFAAVGAIVFSILGAFTVYGLWYIGYLLWTAASIFFLIWLLKYLEIL
ncbi:MAG: hypothetical protein IPJ40_20555 [Saprospirales bacterium]|nr:hypothetical protein [Saprospirales bacterium]